MTSRFRNLTIPAVTALVVLACAAPRAATTSLSVEERLAKLEERQTQLEETLRARDARNREREDELAA